MDITRKALNSLPDDWLEQLVEECDPDGDLVRDGFSPSFIVWQSIDVPTYVSRSKKCSQHSMRKSHMSTEMVPFERQLTLAKAFADSKLFGVQDANQALALMALCEAQGLHPANAVQEYHIINGRPSLKADAMLTRFQRAGGSVAFTTYSDDKVEATFTHPQGGTLTIDWDMARAKKAQLTTAMWTKYPRQMLRSRVISEGVRALFPGVLGGLYTEEEVREMPAQALEVKKDFSPYPEGMKTMDAEFREQYVTSILGNLESITAATVGELRDDKAAIAAWSLWNELDQDGMIQVFQKFNTKQKDRWRKVEHAMVVRQEIAA